MIRPQHTRARFPVASLLVLIGSLVGCGGDGGDTTGPGDSFPDVAGVYNVQGGFDGLSGDQASFVGGLTLTQASRQSGTLTGTMSVTATINGNIITGGNVPIQSGSVTPDGTVSFQLGSLSNGGTWTFTGTAAGETISGRHTLSDGVNSFSGNWTASTGTVGTGSLTVTAATLGPGLDPDGFNVVVDGLGRGTLTGSTPVTVAGLAPGNHAVGLEGVATNCQVQGDNPRLVPVSSGATVTVEFVIVCSPPPAGTGSIRVVVSTGGTDPDPDGYLATLDGTGPGIPVPATGSATFANVAAGSHTVALSGLASNCTASGGGSATTTVSSGATSDVSFAVTCTALPPTSGALRITTATTGPSPDADGYQFAVDGGAAQSIGSNAQVTVAQVAAGSHTVVLSGIADNCSVAGGPSKTVTVAAGQTAEVAFSIECSATPSSSRSGMLAEPKDIPAVSGRSTIHVIVRDAGGAQLEGVPVTLSASGEGNTITPESAITDPSGVAIFTFSSVVSGDKTISATAGGVTLEDTEVITVFQWDSDTRIIGIEPEPSSSGETFTVTVSVTSENGTPTGTVAVFSLQEADSGCDAAPLNDGIAVCEFALDDPGFHSIRAVYSGDGQFHGSSDPDGQPHEVTAAAATIQARSR